MSRIPYYIYDNNPLGFDKSLLKQGMKKIEVKDSLQEVNLRIEENKRKLKYRKDKKKEKLN